MAMKFTLTHVRGPMAYHDSHPFITFQHRVERDRLWVLLGEAYSKVGHLAGTPLQPALAEKLAGIFMIRGAVATTAIEGNTLSVEQVHELQQSGRKLPPSQQYLQQEVDNVLRALALIDSNAREGVQFRLTPEWIREQNRMVLEDLDEEDHVVPGQYRDVSITAGSYVGPPAQDVPYLVDRLCSWLNDDWLRALDRDDTSPEIRFFGSFFAATLAHLYIAWIHPFGDGNGRTARLVECALLAHSGVVPWVCSNLLSDHYNKTRSKYYQRLDEARRDGGVEKFICYSAEGFVDMLREQIGDVQQMQRTVAWINYVHEIMRNEPPGEAQRRRRTLVLALPDNGVRRAEARSINVELATLYAVKQEKTLTRDINRLEQLGLLRSNRTHVIPTIDRMDAFMPRARHL